MAVLSAEAWACVFVLFVVWMRPPTQGAGWWLGDAGSCIPVVSSV